LSVSGQWTLAHPPKSCRPGGKLANPGTLQPAACFLHLEVGELKGAAMRLRTQMLRFVISGLSISLLGIAFRLAPDAATETLSSSRAGPPAVIRVAPEHRPAGHSSWRQMLPGTFSPRRR